MTNLKKKVVRYSNMEIVPAKSGKSFSIFSPEIDEDEFYEPRKHVASNLKSIKSAKQRIDALQDDDSGCDRELEYEDSFHNPHR